MKTLVDYRRLSIGLAFAIFTLQLSGCGPMLSAAAPYHKDPRGIAALSALGEGVTALEAAERSRSSVNVNQGGGSSDSRSRIAALDGMIRSVVDEEWHDGARYTGTTKLTNGATRWVAHGRGLILFPSGEKYDGEWRDGKRNGRGMQSWPNGRSYEGDFRDDKYNGHGILRTPHGGRYEGQFRDNEWTGFGSWADPNGTKLQGEWRGGQPWKTNGLCVYSDGTRQTGTWDHDNLRGGGTIEWLDGRRYEGTWKVKEGMLDDPEGQGAMTWADGRKYGGEFRDGKQSGRGRLSYADGRVEDGTWLAGEFMGGESTVISPAVGTGFVTVTCDIEACEVYVDGDFVGNTPAKLKLSAGKCAVVVRKAGYKEFKRDIKIGAGSELTLKAIMESE